MFGKKCSLCGGKLRGNICTECGLDNSKNDSMYKNLLKRGECEDKPLTHVHADPAEKGKTAKKNTFAKAGTTFSYNEAARKKTTYTSASSTKEKRKRKPFKTAMIVVIFAFMVNALLTIFAALKDEFSYEFEEIGVDRIFSSDTMDAGADDMYDWVQYDLGETGVSWSANLTSGDYVVGVHIPEGTYTVIAETGDCYISVDDTDNGIYLWERMAPEEMSLDDTYVEIYNLRLYEGAVLQLDGYYSLWFQTENANLVEDAMENPLTEDVVFVNEQTLTAGEDFPAGVYDVVAPSGGGYLDFETPIADGEEYAEYYMGSIWLYDENDGEIRYRNLVIPEGVQVSLYGYSEGQTVTLRPSAFIASEDYEEYYLETY